VPALVVLALIVVPLVELYVIIQVGQQIGTLPTIALLVLMSLLGGYLLRREGMRTWRAMRTTLQSGRMPAREVADGALVIFGGALLLTPGFATDLFGLLCILPPTRAVLRRMLTGLVARRLGAVGVVGLATEQTQRSTPPPWARRDGRVVDGEVVEGEIVDGDDGPDRPGRP